MSVVFQRKAEAENKSVVKKHSKTGVVKKLSVQENPTLVKTLETPSTRDVAPRHALGDLSNTTRKPLNHQNKQMKKPVTVLKQTESQTPVKVDDEFPDIEYMPPPVNQDPSPYRTPSYIKDIVPWIVNINRTRFSSKETTSQKDSTRSLRASDDDFLPGLFYQLDIGLGDVDLPDIEDLDL